MDEHPYVGHDGPGTPCGICWIPYPEHPGWSEKAQAAVIEDDVQLDAALRRGGFEG